MKIYSVSAAFIISILFANTLWASNGEHRKEIQSHLTNDLRRQAFPQFRKTPSRVVASESPRPVTRGAEQRRPIENPIPRINRIRAAGHRLEAEMNHEIRTLARSRYEPQMVSLMQERFREQFQALRNDLHKEKKPPEQRITRMMERLERNVSHFQEQVASRHQAMDAQRRAAIRPAARERAPEADESIQGTVRDANTSALLNNIEIDLYDESGDWYGYAYTDVSGVYTFSALSAGTYYAKTYARYDGYIDELYQEISCSLYCDPLDGTPIQVSGPTSGINFTLVQAATIAGRVTEEGSGAPIDSANVEIYDVDGNYYGYGYTDSTGDYAAAGIPPGAYYAATDTNGSFLDELYDDIPCMGSCDYNSGSPIQVSAGATVNGIDFSLGHGGSISGVIRDAKTLAPLSNIYVTAFDSNDREISSPTNSSGTYQISGLITGAYRIYAMDDSGNYVAELYNNIACPYYHCDLSSGDPVSVVLDVDTPNIDVDLTPAARVNGTVKDATTGNPIPWAGWVYVYNSTGESISYSYIDGFGKYSAGGLPAGTYFVKISSNKNYIDELYNNIPCPFDCDVTTGTPITLSDGRAAKVNFALKPGGRIEGTITNAATSLPLYDFYLNVYTSDGEQVAYAYSNNEGNYRVEGLPTGSYFVLTRYSYPYIDELYNNIPCAHGDCNVESGTPVSVKEGATTSGIDFALMEGGKIRGTVTHGGLPLEYISLLAFNSSGRWVADAFTDANGEYELMGLTTGDYYVAADGHSTNYLGEVYDNISCPWIVCDPLDGTPVPVTIGSVTPNINFDLQVAGSIEGRITDRSGLIPIAGTTVTIDSGDLIYAYEYTDGNGNYSVYGLPTGSYVAKTDDADPYMDQLYNNHPCPYGSCDIYSGDWFAVTEGSVTSGIDFALDLGGSIEGAITAADTSLPLTNTQVFIYNEQQQYTKSTWTDDAGHYEASGLPTGSYYVVVRDWDDIYVGELYNDIPCLNYCGLDPGTLIPVTQGLPTTIDFVLERGGSISGTVTASGDGRPIEDADVTIYDSQFEYVGTVSTDSSGRYAKGAITTGNYYARAFERSAYLDQFYEYLTCEYSYCFYENATPVPVQLGVNTPSINFSLDTGGRIEGQVTDSTTGMAISDVSVTVYTLHGDYIDQVDTDASGRYTIGGLYSGKYRVSTYNDEGYLDESWNDNKCLLWCEYTDGNPITVFAGQVINGIDFALDKGGSISGRITNASQQPLQYVGLNIFTMDGDWLAGDYADANGTYQIDGLPEASYYVVAYSDTYIDALYSNVPCMQGNCDLSSGTPVSVVSGSTTTGIDFVLDPGGSISGKMTDASGSTPLDYAEVDVYDSSGNWISYGYTDATGNYLTGGLATDSYFVVTQNWTYIDEVFNNIPCPFGKCDPTIGTPVSVIAGEVTPGIDFSLDSGGIISGKITSAQDSSPLRFEVRLYDSNGSYLTSTWSNDTGDYKLYGMITGDYYVLAIDEEEEEYGDDPNNYIDELYNDIPCPGASCDIRTGTLVPATAGSETSGINFSLSPGGSISGRFTDENGIPLPYVEVMIYDSQGNLEATSYYSNYAGRYVVSGLPNGTHHAVTRDYYGYGGYIHELYDDIPCPDSNCDVTSGTPIPVTVGEETQNINFALAEDIPCLFCDDFNDDEVDSIWDCSAGSWTETDGKFQGTNGTGKAKTYAGIPGCANCGVEALIETAGKIFPGSADAISLLGWYQDKKNSVEVLVKREAGKIILKQKANGNVAKKSGSAAIVPDVPFRLNVSFDGSNFVVNIDGAPVLTMPKYAGSNPSGTFGFVVKGTVGKFDYIRVK